MRKIEEKREKYLMLDDYMLDKDLSKIKMIINIEKLDDDKILIGTDDKWSGYVTIKM